MSASINNQSRVVLITGASSGIGEATARRFATAGATVINMDRRPPEIVTNNVTWHECDVTDADMVRSVVEQVFTTEGRIDTAIANAGISTRHAFLNMKQDDIRRLLDINLFGVINLWQSAGRIMFEHGAGTLLATASTNGSAGYPWYADYNASKAGVLALCRSVALELAPRVRTACVSPGYVLTPMQRSEYTDEMLAEVNERIPMRRHAAPAEIADAFFFLASHQAHFITGQQLIVDGGELAGGTASSYRTQ